MAPSLERIEALAPDQASLAAARKLLKPSGWPILAASEGLAWGECQGSGATPYRVVISEADAGYKCTCPSRKFPCKHSLALMWMRAEGKVAFAPAPVPEWVKDWLGRRRGPGSGAAAVEDDGKPKPSILLAQAEEEALADPRAEARAAAARERNRVEREASILAGLDDLDVWLRDQVDRGMAAFVAQSSKACRLIAQRLVDAKAPALASRVDSLPARLFTLPEPARPTAAVQELGQLHLIAEAYRRQELLPAPLQADARQAVGWAITRETLLADASAVRCEARWRVIAVQSGVQPDRLRRIETWLLRESPAEAAPQFAVLIDFVPVATGAAVGGYIAGDSIKAELVFYPSAVPLRAQIVRVDGGAQPSAAEVSCTASLAQAFAGFEKQLAHLPWLGAAPLQFTGATVRRHQETLYLSDDASVLALPLQPAQGALAMPLGAVGAIDGIALWNGYHLTLLWAQTGLGRWLAA